MALDLFRKFVIRHAHIAGITLDYVTTMITKEHRRKSPPVLEYHHLPTSIERLMNNLQQSRRKTYLGLICIHLNLSHIDHLHLGHGHQAKTLVHPHMPVFTFLYIHLRFQRRCSRTQDHLRTGQMSEVNRTVTAVIARSRIELFIGAVVFFVHYNQSEVLKWKQ